jgi:benzoyl-CoA reductase/2-hydroxyglutaryl-CoA dehydratase subunit BcrC/BadD/HgdB
MQEADSRKGCRPAASENGADRTLNGANTGTLAEALRWFESMIDRCYDYAEKAKADGRPVVGIMCEFTPRELILAAGGVPVCLCGGSAETIPAAEQSLPSNLCPLIKSTFGYHVSGKNPFLNWADLVVAETTCDGKKKMFELMSRSRKLYVLNLPHRADSRESLTAWEAELRRFRSFLEATFELRITEEKLRSAIRKMNRERRLRRELAEFMALEAPPLTGRQLLECKSIISAIDEDLEAFERLIQRLRESVPGMPHRSPVRVLLTGVPLVHGAERVMEIIESCGAVVVAAENCTGLKPILEDVAENEPDPIVALARKYLHLPCSVMTPNQRRFETLDALVRKFRPECVIELVWQACLTYDIESVFVREFAEKAGRPYLKITTDYSSADSARINARVSALVEMVKDGRAQ